MRISELFRRLGFGGPGRRRTPTGPDHSQQPEPSRRRSFFQGDDAGGLSCAGPTPRPRDKGERKRRGSAAEGGGLRHRPAVRLNSNPYVQRGTRRRAVTTG